MLAERWRQLMSGGGRCECVFMLLRVVLN